MALSHTPIPPDPGYESTCNFHSHRSSSEALTRYMYMYMEREIQSHCQWRSYSIGLSGVEPPPCLLTELAGLTLMCINLFCLYHYLANKLSWLTSSIIIFTTEMTPYSGKFSWGANFRYFRG